MNSYSQYGEDKIVAEIFGGAETVRAMAENRGPEPGRAALLDIGAWGPKDLSNTRAFIECGWRAVLCEFSPKPVRELVQEYSADLNGRSRVEIVQCAVTPVHQHCLEFQITDDALSATPDSETVRKWGKDNAGGYFGRLFVPTVPLKDLMNQFFGSHTPDYVSIDTEGTSVDLLLEMWYALSRRPKAIICEHDGRDTQIWEAAKQCGYSVRDRNETNVVLEHRA